MFLCNILKAFTSLPPPPPICCQVFLQDFFKKIKISCVCLENSIKNTRET